jgi:hypothetical protein
MAAPPRIAAATKLLRYRARGLIIAAKRPPWER